MRKWRGYLIIALWIGWTLFLAIMLFAVVIPPVVGNGNWALPLPTRIVVSGNKLLVWILVALVTLLVVYLPPLLATAIWFRRREKR